LRAHARDSKRPSLRSASHPRAHAAFAERLEPRVGADAAAGERRLARGQVVEPRPALGGRTVEQDVERRAQPQPALRVDRRHGGLRAGADQAGRIHS
jgi:hypothetical protein